MSLRRKVMVSVSWLAIAQVARRGWGLLVTAVLARLLVPSDFGLVALTLMATGGLAIFSDMGLASALVQRAEVDEEHLSTAFWVNVALGVALALLGMALAFPLSRLYHEPRAGALLMAMMLTLPLSSVGQVPGVLLQRRLEFRSLALIDLGSSLASGLLGLLLAHEGAGVWALAAQYIGLALLSSLGRLIASRWRPRLLFRPQRVRDLLSFSASVLGGALVNYAVCNIDNALIGGALGTAALGMYVMAYNLVLLPGQSIGGLVNQVLFPALASMQNDPARLRGAYLRALRVVALLAFPCVAGLGATAPLFVHVVYGPQWAPAVPLLEVLCIVGLWQAINLSSMIFYAMGRPNVVLGWAIVSLAVLCVGFAVGVHGGAVGVAWSYAVLTPIVCLVPHLLAYRFISLRLPLFAAAVLPFLCASLIMAAMVRLSLQMTPLFRWPAVDLLALALLGASIYGALLIAMGVLLNRGKWMPWLLGHHMEHPPQPEPSPVEQEEVLSTL